MIRFLRHWLHFQKANRRVLSGALGVFLLGFLLFSSLAIGVEADHDCSGRDCPVCVLLQCCLDGFHWTGMPSPADDAPAWGGPIPYDPVFVPEYRAPATTLQSLFVRMNE